MVVHSEDGYRPLVTYARRAHKPLAETITDSGQPIANDLVSACCSVTLVVADSWSMLGTNLSVKNASGTAVVYVVVEFMEDTRGYVVVQVTGRRKPIVCC